MSEEYGYRQDAGDLPDPSGAEGDGPIDFDQLFSLLSDDRRRYALYRAADREGASVATSALVDDVVALERRVSESGCRRREAAITLRHTHLPKLSAAAVIDYDPDAGEVVYRGGPRVDRWLETVREAELESP